MHNKNVAHNQSKISHANYFQDQDIFDQIVNVAKSWAERTVNVSNQGKDLKRNVSKLYFGITLDGQMLQKRKLLYEHINQSKTLRNVNYPMNNRLQINETLSISPEQRN